MTESNVVITPVVLARLDEMASWTGLPIAEILERAVNEHYERQFWAAVNTGYAALRADPSAWAEIELERRLWDNTLMDGLDRSERWTEDGSSSPTDSEPKS